MRGLCTGFQFYGLCRLGDTNWIFWTLQKILRVFLERLSMILLKVDVGFSAVVTVVGFIKGV